MKRPEGYDPGSGAVPPPRGGRSGSGSASTGAGRSGRTASPSPRVAGPVASAPAAGSSSGATPRDAAARRRPRSETAAQPTVPRPSRHPKPGAASAADLRRAARARRAAERAEVRRFTRRARTRRVAIAAILGTIAVLAGLVLTAVYSPILALREVRVEGAARVDPAQITAAVDDQIGTPLALLDLGKVESALGQFPLIRSYVTRIVPPDTLVVQIVERQPVGAISTPSGFSVVDPAGIVLEESADRLPGIPVIDLAGGDVSSPAFEAAVSVLLALPPALTAQVDTITAHTQDDVSLVLTGVGQRVAWGSADEAAKKAALLAALIAVTDPSRPGEFDVSAPTNGVFRPS